MKRLITRLLGLDVELEAALDLMREYRSMAEKARAELDGAKQALDAAIESHRIESSRLRFQQQNLQATIDQVAILIANVRPTEYYVDQN